MEFKPGDYILGVYHASNKCGDDFIMTILRRKDADLFEFEYRFRYNARTTDPFDGKDTKNFYSGKTKPNEPEDQIIKKMDMMFQLIIMHYPIEAEYVEIKGDMDKMIFKLAQKEWCHIKRVEVPNADERS